MLCIHLQVANKVNTIQIDSCVKTSVVVESCVASVDIINCKSVEVQITDWTPMITIDGCAGVIVYLSQVWDKIEGAKEKGIDEIDRRKGL